MEIGFTYSSKDPRQLEARNFVRRFVEDRGILARITEAEKDVKTPEITIDGWCLTQPIKRESSGKEAAPSFFPTLDDLARALERTIWSL